KPSFEIAAMKKLARQQPAGLVLDQQMVDSVAAEAPVSNGLAADHPRANGVGSVWLNVFHLRELDPVFVAKRQVPEQISHRVDVTLGEQFRALRAHALDHARFAREAHGHGLLFISSPRGPCGKRETCVAPPRSEEHTSELQSPDQLVCRLLLVKKMTRCELHLLKRTNIMS